MRKQLSRRQHIALASGILCVLALLQTSVAQGAARVTAALELLHVPYVYGGVSPIGLDCSGLVQGVFGRTGMPLARDELAPGCDRSR